MKIPLLLALIGVAFIGAALSAFSSHPEDQKSPMILSDQGTGAYPLATCVVSGEKLGEMGKPVVINYQGTEVRFCCNDCAATFQKDPSKYLAKLKSIAAKP